MCCAYTHRLSQRGLQAKGYKNPSKCVNKLRFNAVHQRTHICRKVALFSPKIQAETIPLFYSTFFGYEHTVLLYLFISLSLWTWNQVDDSGNISCTVIGASSMEHTFIQLPIEFLFGKSTKVIVCASSCYASSTAERVRGVIR